VNPAENRDQVAELSAEDRLEVAAWIAHLNRAEDPAYQAALDRRMAAMDAGRKTPAEAVERLHLKPGWFTGDG
jgi:hypothetical protein